MVTKARCPTRIQKNNKSYNRLFLLPLYPGDASGLFFQYRRNRRDFLVTGLLFFFTGLAIVLYLNQAGMPAARTGLCLCRLLLCLCHLDRAGRHLGTRIHPAVCSA